MRKDVVISIKSTETGEDGPETLEFITDGRLVDREGTYYISYRESELTGMSGTTTVLKLEEPKRLTVTRTGAVTSELVFEKDRRCVAAYTMEEGSLSVGVRAYDLWSDMTPCGGKIRLGYTVDMDSHLTGTHVLEVSVREKQKKQEYEYSECVKQ